MFLSGVARFTRRLNFPLRNAPLHVGVCVCRLPHHSTSPCTKDGHYRQHSGNGGDDNTHVNARLSARDCAFTLREFASLPAHF